MSQSEESIRAALMALLDKFPYATVNVQSICDKAGVSRKTFSRHFSSKEDVVISQLQVDTTATSEKIMDIVPVASLKDSTRFILTSIYTHLYNHRNYYLKVADELGSEWIAARMYETSLKLGSMPYWTFSGSDVEKDFLISYMSGVNATAVRWWLDRGFDLDPESIVKMVIFWGYSWYDQNFPK